MRKKKFQYGIYTGQMAVLWWVEVHLFKWLFSLQMRAFFSVCRFLLFVLNLIGKAIDKLIWVIAKLFKKEYELNIAEKMIGYPYRLYIKIEKWWKNLICGEQAKPELKEPRPYWMLREPEPHVQMVNYNYDTGEVMNTLNTQEDEKKEKEEIVEELPFCQIFRLGGDKDLHIMRVEYCPDETSFIRVVSNDSYTKPYKRKVQRDKRGERFILFNNERFYLDPNKTQPRMPE